MAFNQPLTGLIEPDTDEWRSATPERRRAFYREAGRRARARLRKQLLKGIGRSGRLMPARKRPRPDGADGPVMDPHEVDSRTVTLLDFRADTTGVTLYWHRGPARPDQTKPWSTILGYHAAGAVPGAPVRDVRLSNLNIHHLKREMGEWFEGGEVFRRLGSATVRTAIPKKRKFKATGRFDLHNASFGGGGIGGSREEVGQSIAEGNSTGFRQRGRPSRFKPVVARKATKPLPRVDPLEATAPAATIRPPSAGAAANIGKAVAHAESLGIKVDRNGHRVIAKAKGEEKARGIPASYASKTKTIYINEHSDYWHDPKGFMDAMKESRWFSTDKPVHAIVHETAHALHDRSVGEDQYNALRTKTLSGTLKELIEKEVSGYAATNPLEFVAEVFTGRKSGKTYDPRLIKLYETMKGPRP